MRLGVIPENVIERVVLASGVVPSPLFDTMMAMLLARTVMVGTKVGVFETLAAGELSANDVAAKCRTHPDATAKLLNALAGAGYLDFEGGKFALTPLARKWLLADSPNSLYENTLFHFLEWKLIENYEEFLQTGKPHDLHTNLESADDWGLYQRGMRSLASTSSGETADRTPIPKSARDMLDIGGSHGFHSVAMCRRYPNLKSTVLDLPDAVAQAAPILAKEGMGDRVVHRAGNALTDDLGTEKYDVVFAAQVLHHFDDATNRELAKRVAKALRPGGVYVIQEAIRPKSPKEAGQTGGLLDLFFAFTSQAGTWSFEEMASWQRDAGLVPAKPLRFRTVPGIGQQTAAKR